MWAKYRHFRGIYCFHLQGMSHHIPKENNLKYMENHIILHS